jgi:hypothetical protein
MLNFFANSPAGELGINGMAFEGMPQPGILMENLKDRTKRFALDVIRFCGRLPNRPMYWLIRRQLMDCATSVGANYRSACRGNQRLTSSQN